MAFNQQFIFDSLLEIKDAGLVAASAAATVGGSAVIRDLGEGFVQGNFIVDVTAIEIASNNELYTIILEGSTSSTFASAIVQLAVLNLGANEVLVGGCDTDSTTGRYVVPFRNEKDQVIYPYVRGYTVVAGSIATGGGINWAGWLAKTFK